MAEVTSPPYDVIAHDTERHLLAADPHNVVRLILPRRDQRNPPDGYRGAAMTLRAWQEGGILVPDPRPALYVYEQSLPGGTVIQRGLIGALGLAPLDGGPVLPHEEVMPGPVSGRRQLMEATEANLEPIFLLYDGQMLGGPLQPGAAHSPGAPGAHPASPRAPAQGASGGRHGASSSSSPATATLLASQAAAHGTPLVVVDTADGIRHRLWALTDPAEHAAVAADLASRQALIADGHHRYAAYLELQRRKRASGAGPGPWDAGLALLVDLAAFPPRIGAIHRVISGLDVTEAAERAAGAFTVRALSSLSARTPGEALRRLHDAGKDGVAFILAGGGKFHLLTDPDPRAAEEAMPGRSSRWRSLSAAVLQELLLAKVWGIQDSEAVQIHHDAAGALRAAEAPAGGTAVICPPLSATDVLQVAALGERVPRKSTSFAPKPRTGLVIRSFALG